MIKKIGEYIIPIALIALSQFGFGIYSNSKESRVVAILEAIPLDSTTYYQSVLIDNDSKLEINSLRMVVSDGKIEKIFVKDDNIKIKVNDNEINVSKVYPHRVVSFAIQMKANYNRTVPNIEVINSELSNTDVIGKNDYHKKLKVNWLSLVFNALISGMLYIIFMMFMNFHFNKQIAIREDQEKIQNKENELLNKRLDELEIKHGENDQEKKKLEKEIVKATSRFYKYMLLFRKLHVSTEKENDYFKSLICSFVKGDMKKYEKDEMWMLVQKELKTFRNSEITSDIDALDVIENIVSEKQPPPNNRCS